MPSAGHRKVFIKEEKEAAHQEVEKAESSSSWTSVDETAVAIESATPTKAKAPIEKPIDKLNN